jgi:hypothetical protein
VGTGSAIAVVGAFDKVERGMYVYSASRQSASHAAGSMFHGGCCVIGVIQTEELKSRR